MLDTLDIVEDLARYSNDPLGFVYWAYPWGEVGELEKFPLGPDKWHIEVLSYLSETLRNQEETGLYEPILISICSGHGVGKSAFVGWITDWGLTTFEDTRGVITANTENQLKTKTWVEIAKWHRLSMAREMSKLTATALFSSDPEREKIWRMDIVPWSLTNTEAFAGLHNQRKRIVIVLDESSAIPDPIWEVIEGALTDADTQIIVIACGNPTRATGRFRETLPDGKFGHRWKNFRVDSREVRITNKTQIDKMIADYGADSDYVRVRILGLPPRVDASSFITRQSVIDAMAREVPFPNPARAVLGVDTARFGDDKTVIVTRRGVDARSVRPIVRQGLNSIQIATLAFNEYITQHAACIYVDTGGPNAGGTIDQLIVMGATVIPVDFGGSADFQNAEDPSTLYANKRAEMYGALRHWLRRGCLPPEVPGLDRSLVDELCTFTYSFRGKQESILLESKADLKHRGEPSPDYGDALALTFAYPMLELSTPLIPVPQGAPARSGADYDPFSAERMAS
jgi:hypothetical protein